MAVPMAYWAARENAVVLFLRFHRHRRTWQPMAMEVSFPGGRYGLGGEAIVYSGSSRGDSGISLHGIAAPAVKYLALSQDGHEDRRSLDNHYGAWIVRTDKPGPFRVAAIDEHGTTIAEIEPRFGRH